MPNIICQRCHAINESNATSCQQCGARFCPYCHLLIESPNATVCPHCGKKDTSFRPGRFGGPAAPSSSVSSQTYCSNCGSRLSPGTRTCPFCGRMGKVVTQSPVQGHGVMQPAVPAKPQLDSQFRCSKCGKPISSKFTKCLDCGFLGPHTYSTPTAGPAEIGHGPQYPQRRDSSPLDRGEQQAPAVRSERYSEAIDIPAEPPSRSSGRRDADDSRFPVGMRHRSPMLDHIEDMDLREKTEPKKLVCPNCKNPVPERSKVCPTCGNNRLPPENTKPFITNTITHSPMQGHNVLEPAQDDSVYNYDLPPAIEPVLTTQRVCSKCHTPIPPGSSLCPIHGKFGGESTLIEDTDLPPGRHTSDLWRRIDEKRAAAVSGQTGADDQRFCPNCNNPVPDRSKVCPTCGNNRLPSEKTKPFVKAEDRYKAVAAAQQSYAAYAQDQYYGQPAIQPYEMAYSPVLPEEPIQGDVPKEEAKDTLALNVTPLTLGIETDGGLTLSIIPRGTFRPIQRKMLITTVTDGQSSIEINVLLGERPLSADNKSLARLTLDGIPPAPKGVPQIEVIFSFDYRGLLRIRAYEKEIGKEYKITFSKVNDLRKDDVEKLLKEAELHAAEDNTKHYVARIHFTDKRHK